MKIEHWKWISDQIFRFELANRFINLFRSLLLVMIFVKLFEIPIWGYVVIIVVYGLSVWYLGYLMDKTKFYKQLTKAGLIRNHLMDELIDIKNKNHS